MMEGYAWQTITVETDSEAGAKAVGQTWRMILRSPRRPDKI